VATSPAPTLIGHKIADAPCGRRFRTEAHQNPAGSVLRNLLNPGKRLPTTAALMVRGDP